MKTLFPTGRMASAILEAVQLRGKLIAEGTDPDEANHIVGKGLRAVWGSEREEPWHYYCQRCNDSGTLVVEPTYMEKQRLTRMYGPNPTYQDYMQPCEPNCRYREREREKRRQKVEL